MDEDKKKSLEYLTPIADGLRIMDKNAGWKWLKELILSEREKNLDILLGNGKMPEGVNDDILKGQIREANFITENIDIMRSKHKKLMMEEDE